MHLRQRTFGQQDVGTFVNLTGDQNPVHLAQSDSTVVPGLLVASLFPAIIGSKYPGTLYARQDLKFERPVLVCLQQVAGPPFKRQALSTVGQLEAEGTRLVFVCAKVFAECLIIR